MLILPSSPKFKALFDDSQLKLFVVQAADTLVDYADYEGTIHVFISEEIKKQYEHPARYKHILPKISLEWLYAYADSIFDDLRDNVDYEVIEFDEDTMDDIRISEARLSVELFAEHHPQLALFALQRYLQHHLRTLYPYVTFEVTTDNKVVKSFFKGRTFKTLFGEEPDNPRMISDFYDYLLANNLADVQE